MDDFGKPLKMIEDENNTMTNWNGHYILKDHSSMSGTWSSIKNSYI